MNYGDTALPPRFWDKVEVDPETGCWLWTGSIDRDGYAQIWWAEDGEGPARERGKTVFAHRLAKVVDEEAGIGDRDGEDAHHRKACKGRHCVRPDHLHWEDRQAHRWHEAKMQNVNGDPCTGSAHCMCYECCEERAKTAEDDGVPF